VVGKNNARELVDLRNVVSDAKAMIFGTLDNSKIIFNITAPANLRKIKGDRTKLIQVFLNLFKNSVDSIIASQNQDKNINVSIENNEERITILITDNGLGFESDIKAQLFNRGFTTKTSGSGIGLANCKSIIEGHNGDLTLDSDGAGKGSTTTVYFNL
jgi:signal transduction histidine kinase